MSTPSTYGPWSVGTARLSSKGGLCAAGRGKVSVEDVYTLVLDRGARPAPGLYGIPDYGDAYTPGAGESEDFADLYVKSVEPSQSDPTSLVWEIRVKYERNSSGDDEEEGVDEGNWTRATVGHQTYQEELVEDVDGTPVVNSAGDAFENAPQVDRNLLQITLVKTCKRSPVSTVVALHDTINDAPVSVLRQTIPARCGRVSLEAERLFGTKSSWSLTITITVNPETWDIKVLQNGYRYKDSNGNLVKFTDTTADGRVVECSTPQLLGDVGDGGDGRGRGPYYATFKPYKAENWTRLGLPDNVGGGGITPAAQSNQEGE